MARPLGIPVVVSPSWFVVAVLITVAFAPTVRQLVPGVGGWSYVVAAVFAVLLYLSVLVHELSHSVVAVRSGLQVRRITLHLLGGLSEITTEPRTPGREFAIAIAGHAAALLLGGLGLGLLALTPSGTVLQVLAGQLALANLLVGVFNLLPGLPLDGGRVVSAAVWKLTGNRSTGTIAAAWTGRGLAVLILLVPLALARVQDGAGTVLDLVWAALLAWFIWLGASQSLAFAHAQQRLPLVNARRLARRALPVRPDEPLSEAIRRAIAARAAAMVVVDADGRPAGLVNEAAVVAVPEQRRPWVDVATVARRLDPTLVLPVTLGGEDLLRALAGHPAPEYLVVDEQGRVYGVLASSDVEREFAGRR
jgi:Zn-dependent protease